VWNLPNRRTGKSCNIKNATSFSFENSFDELEIIMKITTSSGSSQGTDPNNNNKI
jgi:hypothetical protein